MEYIEKAKYELIMALQNDESQVIIDVLKQYYTDIVNIVNNSSCIYKDYEYITNPKYILMIHCENSVDNKIYYFSCKDKLLNFYNSYVTKDQVINIIKLDKINPFDIKYNCKTENINEADSLNFK
jgi:hypothetical protein